MGLESIKTARFISGKTYDVCYHCGKIVRADKPLLADFHICALPGDFTQAELTDRIAESLRLLISAR